MKRVVFLDVDGPLIPGRAYTNPVTHIRRNRKGEALGYRFDAFCVRMVTTLVKQADACIVFNTMHNERGLAALKEDMAESGLAHDLLHPTEPQTDYPSRKMSTAFRLIATHTRIRAIEMWLARHPEVEQWVALDDEKIPHANAVLVNFDAGTTSGNVDRAFQIFGLQHRLTVDVPPRLTPHQKMVLAYVRTQVGANGKVPHPALIAAHMGWDGTNRVNDVMTALAAKGLVRLKSTAVRAVNKPREWELVS